jgi:hypothetical protein
MDSLKLDCDKFEFYPSGHAIKGPSCVCCGGGEIDMDPDLLQLP